MNSTDHTESFQFRIKRALIRIARKTRSLFIRNRVSEMRPEGQSRKGLVDLINKLNRKDMVVVEIGSYRGESAEIFLGTGKVAKIYCVDPWKPSYDLDDGAAYTDMRKVESDFDRRHAANPHVIKVKGTIDTFIERFRDNPDVIDKIDVIYIDGLHTYEGVHHDIEMTLTYIKPRLAIAGHDYYFESGRAAWPGVVQAVEELIGIPDMTFDDGSWLKAVGQVA